MQVKIAWTILISFVSLAAVAVVFWWSTEFHTEHTKQAYVRGSVMQITAPYEGRVSHINIKSYMPVKQGEVLFEMRDSLLQPEYAAAKAEYEFAVSEYNLIKAKKAHESHGVELLEQKLATAERKYQHISDLLAKYQQLDKRNVGEIEYTRTKTTQAESAQNYLTVKAELEKAHKTYQELKLQLNSMQAKIDLAASKVAAKQSLIAQTVIVAPVDGVVGEIKVEQGQLVKSHDLLAQLYYDNDKWVLANFTEKQIKQLKIGQTATVQLDAFPNIPLKAEVKLFAPATRLELNQLPLPEQMGEIIRVEQQLPVIIDIIEPHPLQDVIKPGMSATVRVDTRKPVTANQ